MAQACSSISGSDQCHTKRDKYLSKTKGDKESVDYLATAGYRVEWSRCELVDRFTTHFRIDAITLQVRVVCFSPERPLISTKPLESTDQTSGRATTVTDHTAGQLCDNVDEELKRVNNAGAIRNTVVMTLIVLLGGASWEGSGVHDLLFHMTSMSVSEAIEDATAQASKSEHVHFITDPLQSL
ncbi:unnamed protein product [Spodoptera exigua]|nr:unnamed protein product [Spodoptera exigua]